MEYDDIALAEKATRAPGAPADDTYDAMASQEADRRRNALKASINIATQVNPEKAGAQQRLSDVTGLPLPVVERNEDYVAQQQRARDIHAAMQDSPVLARQMTDPNFAKIAQDDVPQLNAFTKAVRSLHGMVRAAAAGATYDVASGIYGVGEVFAKNIAPLGDWAAGTILPENPLRRVAVGLEGLRKSAQRGSEIISGEVPEAPEGGFVEQGIKSGFRSTGQMLPGLAMSIATRDPKYVLASGGALAGSQSATKALDAGKSPGKALVYGLEDAVAEVVTEKLPMGVLLRDLNAGASFKRVLAHQFATEVPTELAATAWQNANEWANLNPEKTFGDYIKELGPDMAQTVIATITQVVLTVGMGKVGHHVLTQRVQEQQAINDAEAFKELLGAAGLSRVRERSAQSFSQFVANATDEGPVDAVYANAAVFAQGAADAGIDIATLMPKTAQDLQEALATNRDVRIPLNELSTTIPGTTLEQSLVPHLRTDPNAPTQLEASDAQWIADTQAQTEKILAEHDFTDAWRESQASVEKELLTQLHEAGRFTPDVNKAYAGFMSAFYSTQAHRLGITPEQMYVKYPLQIRSSSLNDSRDLYKQADQLSVIRQEDDPNPFPEGMHYAVAGGTVGTLEYFKTHAEAEAWRKQEQEFVNEHAASNDGTLDQPAYHGSPHDFDKFSTDAIGTGEGAQAYGWGLYFAENPSVAAGYYRQLADNPTIEEMKLGSRRIGQRNSFAYSPRDNSNIENVFGTLAEGLLIDENMLHAIGVDGFQTHVLKELDELIERYKKEWPEGAAAAETLRKMLARPGAVSIKFDKTTGGVYQVDIPDEAVAKMLLWDKPLSEQPASVRDALAGIGYPTEGDPTGEKIYHGVSYHQGREAGDTGGRVVATNYEAASKALAAAGIPGIKYADAGSRSMSFRVYDTKGNVLGAFDTEQEARAFADSQPSGIKTTVEDEGTRNLVVFDDSIITLTHKDGTPVTAKERDEYLQSPVDQTQTDAFKKWFGDSKVVGENGKPLVVYHGTKGDFDIFDTSGSKRGKFIGSMFTADKEYAENYGREERGGRVVAAYLKIENPLDADNENDYATYKAHRLNGESIAEYAKRAGYDGAITSLNEYIVFSPEQIKSATDNSGAFDANDPNILHQPRASQTGARANISFNKNQPAIMTLLANADLSSFLHESGHFYLEVLADMARQPNAPQQIVDDFAATMKWFGVTPEQWEAFDIEQKRDFHEQWARGFEAYLFEGKSPSTELSGLFARFRAWMVNVYRQLTELNVTLTGEVRAVMDRLVATNDEIIETEAARAYAPIFDVKPDGVTDDEWKAYQEQQLDATQEAIDTLQTRSLRDMQWLTGARSRALKSLQKSAAEKRQAVRAEVAAEVDALPIYIAQRGLKNGWVQDDGGKLMVKFDTKALAEMYPESMVNRPDLTKLHGMTNAETGLNPDDVAALVGFDSGDELVRKLTTLESRVQVIEGITDQRMLQHYGDIVDPQAIERAADEAVHNNLRARVLSTELSMLSKAIGDKNLLNKTAKEFAATIIARQQLKNIKPHLYAAAEARAGKAAETAIKKNDLKTAAAQKRTQVVNMHATKAAYDSLTEVQKGMAAMRRVLKGTNEDIAKTRDVDVVQAARAVLADYGIGKKGKAAQEYLKAVQAYDPGMYDVLRDRVDALTQNAKPVTDLTLDEFRALRDEIGSMMHLARRSKQMEVDGDLMDRQDVQDELYTRMEAIGIPAMMPGSEHAVTDAERRLAKFQTARAALRRVESWVGVKDGKELFGPFRKYVWSQIKDAADAYRADKAVHLKKYRAMLEAINDSLKPSRINAPELGYTFGFSRGGSGTAELLHAILHTGNDSNKRKLLLGRQWAKEDAEGNLDTSKWDAFVARMIAEKRLTKAHFDFAQSVWNMFEATKPLAQKTHRDVFGYYFAEITAQPFTTAFGDYAGGYVPAIADPEIVTDAKTRALMEEENQGMQFAFPSTNKGFTKGRVEYNRPLLLDLRVMSQHLDKVLLFSHLEQPVRDVRRVLTSKKVAYALNRIDPAAFDGLLTPWLNRTAHQQVETPVAGSAGLMRFFTVTRSRAGMAAMFANVSNTVQQITGLSTAAVKVKPKYLLGSMADFIAHPVEFTRAVSESSVYMNNRMENEVAQMTDAINDILLNPSVYEKATTWTAKHSYFLQSAVDNVIGPIVWTGAYNEALEMLPLDIKDEQRLKQARRLADGAVRETQGGMLPEEVSRIETGNAFVRLFTQFAGYFNTQANMLGTEFAKVAQDTGLRKGAGRAFYILLLGFLGPAWVSEFIAQAFKGGPDDEDKDGSYLDDWLAAVFGFGALRYGMAMVPVVGQIANAAVNTLNKKPYDDRISTAPAISMIESAVSAPHSVYKAIVEDGKPSKAVKDVAALVSLLVGVPASAVARPVSYIADVMANRVTPTSPVDAARGAVTGAASPASKNR